jgi:hypothetical protein
MHPLHLSHSMSGALKLSSGDKAMCFVPIEPFSVTTLVIQ